MRALSFTIAMSVLRMNSPSYSVNSSSKPSDSKNLLNLTSTFYLNRPGGLITALSVLTAFIFVLFVLNPVVIISISFVIFVTMKNG